MKRGRKKVANPATARRILAAAEHQFAAQGMAGARTEEIASAAHANKAMLYYYFGNKRRLHRAVLENLFRQLRTGVYDSPRKQASPRERLREFITAYFDFLASHPNYPRLSWPLSKMICRHASQMASKPKPIVSMPPGFADLM
jgi:AcrR family transcriptional regulator